MDNTLLKDVVKKLELSPAQISSSVSGRLLSLKDIHWLLCEKAIMLEDEYFNDMTTDALEEELTNYQNKNGDYVTSDLLMLSVEYWNFLVVEKFKEDWVLASCNYENKAIILHIDEFENDNTLLHEMIHAYEFELESYPSIKDYLLLRLYDKLLKKIPELLELIRRDNNIYMKEHSALFLLKST